MLLLKQNQMLIDALVKNNQEVTEPKKESIQIIPDLAKSVPSFNGEGDSSEAKFWLRQIKSKKSLHFWSDDICLQLAQSHLTAGAQQWFRTHQHDINNEWSEFEKRFKKTFIGETKLTVKCSEMMNRKQKKGESITTYVFEKYRLCMELELSFDDAKEEVITGLFSRELSNLLASKTHADLDDMLADIHSFGKRNQQRQDFFTTPTREGRGDNHEGGLRRPHRRTEAFEYPTIKDGAEGRPFCCYKCGKRGHLSKECKESAPKCFQCNRFGHIAKDCPESQTGKRGNLGQSAEHLARSCQKALSLKDEIVVKGKPTQMEINVASQDSVSKYIKSCFINDCQTCVSCLIDPGSTSCTLVVSVAKNCNLDYSKYDVEIYGFGDVVSPAAHTIGRTTSKLIIDGVSADVDLLIVPDGTQPSPLIV